MTSQTPAPASRMSAEDRRQLVLDAATRAFARRGYAGTSTDAVAKEAGVSQPYVVRIFGTKLELFLEVFTHATGRIAAAFQGVLAERPFDPDSEADWERLGAAYTGLLADRDFLLVMMHGFTAAGTEEIGAAARAGMAGIFDVIRSTGCTDDRARDFIAQGMLLNVMIAMQAPEHRAESGPLAALTACAFGESLPLIAASAGSGDPR
ncbi:TetR/AcrR family transcriptional regulator [Nocardioides sp. MAHUQ-72]|uniref:TetR/AcrR family transcriptional regulator n=1 Tax=unclassified Nocardioides TaxID=2615069 RepID=UPI00361D7874